jgi:hypothetical protein
MTTAIETYQTNPRARFVRAGAGLITVAAAVDVVIGAVTSFLNPSLAQPGSAAFEYSGAVLTIAHVMVLAGFVALALTLAAGSGWLPRIAYLVTFVGLAAQVLGESILRVNFDLGNTFFSFAAPASAVGLVLLGVAILRAHRWSGWHRYVVLATGIYVPVVLIPAFAIASGPSFIALTGWSICFFFCGIAMWAEQGRVNP